LFRRKKSERKKKKVKKPKRVTFEMSAGGSGGGEAPRGDPPSGRPCPLLQNLGGCDKAEIMRINSLDISECEKQRLIHQHFMQRAAQRHLPGAPCPPCPLQVKKIEVLAFFVLILSFI
jgi:hypothetical protein